VGKSCGDIIHVNASIFSSTLVQNAVIFDGKVPFIKDSSGQWIDMGNIIRYKPISDSTAFFYFYSMVQHRNYFLVIHSQYNELWNIGRHNKRVCFNDSTCTARDSMTHFGYSTVMESSFHFNAPHDKKFVQIIGEPTQIKE
jgi:hypothetical protein